MNILALDIDDSILPSDQTYFGETTDSLVLFEINLKRIVLMCKKWNMKIMIISAWSSNLKYENNHLSFIRNSLGNLENGGQTSGELLFNYLSPFIYGIKTEGKEKTIRKLLEDGHNVITIEDSDFSHIEHPNHLFLQTYGFIDNYKSYLINQFLKGK